MLVLPIFAFANNHDSDGEISGGDSDGEIFGGDQNNGDGVVIDFNLLPNPLDNAGIEDIPKFVEVVLNIVLKIGVPIIALAIIYSGFLFVAAQGNPEKLKKARQAFLWTMVGAAILLAAVAIAQAIGGTIDQLRG